METLETVLLILLILDSIALVGLVLMQQSKGADIGAAFGSGSSSTVFGASGSTSFLVKLTSLLAVGFFVIAFGLAYIAKEKAVDLRVYETAGTEPTATETTEIEGGDTTVPVVEGDDLPPLVVPTAEESVPLPPVESQSEEAGDTVDEGTETSD